MGQILTRADEPMSEIARELSRDEFYALFEKDAPVISSFTVGFALVRVVGREEDAYLGGSGTLVTIDQRYGILTAGHVVSSLLEHNGDTGLILAKHGRSPIHKLSFTVAPDKCTFFPNAAHSGSGPDLGFIELDPLTASIVQGSKSFCNLARRRDPMLKSPPSPDRGAWYISGMPGEWTKEGEGSTSLRRVKEFRGMIGEVKVARSFARDGFDYVVVDALVGGQQWPDDYRGYSGSGIWQVLIRERDGHLEIADRILSAVTFFQSSTFEKYGNRVRELFCHGSNSIYGSLIDAVRANAS